MAVLFHLRILQRIVEGMARLMVWVMDVSGTESIAAAANFAGTKIIEVLAPSRSTDSAIVSKTWAGAFEPKVQPGARMKFRPPVTASAASMSRRISGRDCSTTLAWSIPPMMHVPVRWRISAMVGQVGSCAAQLRTSCG